MQRWEREPWKAPREEKSVTLITHLHCIYLNERSLAPLSLTGRVSRRNEDDLCLFIYFRSTATGSRATPELRLRLRSSQILLIPAGWRMTARQRDLWFPLSSVNQVSHPAFSSALLAPRQGTRERLQEKSLSYTEAGLSQT